MTISRSLAAFIVAGVIATAPLTLAQESQPVVGPSAKAKTLSGLVRGANGLALSGVSITLFDCGDGSFQGNPRPHAISETKSDGKGKFDLKWPVLPRVCLQFQSPGVSTMQMEVLRAQDAGKLDVKLVPGT